MPRTPLEALWGLPSPRFQEADVRMAAVRHDASLGNVETVTLTLERWSRGERRRILRQHDALQRADPVSAMSTTSDFVLFSLFWFARRLQDR